MLLTAVATEKEVKQTGPRDFDDTRNDLTAWFSGSRPERFHPIEPCHFHRGC